MRSLIGRFLEHGRIVCFGNGHQLPSPEALVFISSADWMPRNFDWRVEALVPIENETVHRQVLEEIMVHSLQDEAQSWWLDAEGVYHRVSAEGGFSAHTYFMTNPSLSGRGSALHRTRHATAPRHREGRALSPDERAQLAEGRQRATRQRRRHRYRLQQPAPRRL